MIQLGPEKKKKKKNLPTLLVKPKIASAISDNAILSSKVHSIKIFFNFIENTPCDSIKF